MLIIAPSEFERYIKENNLETQKIYFNGEKPTIKPLDIIYFTNKKKLCGYVERIIKD